MNPLSNGPQKKLSCVTKTWEESESIFWMLPYTLMPSTEEVVKSFQPPEESIMLLKWPHNQDYKNLFSSVKLLVQLMPWEEFIQSSIKEEVLSTKKNKSLVPHLTSSELIYLSQNLSDSPLPWEEPPPDKLSHNASFPIGLKLPEILSMPPVKQECLLKKSD